MFRVGDLIAGTGNRYVVTNNQGIMRVEDVCNDENIILVRLLFHKTKKDFIGRRFRVDSAYFKKIGACLK